jgi:hypothetical protein
MFTAMQSSLLLYPEAEDTKFCRNAGSYSTNGMASRPSKREYSATLLW